jgi:molybdate transport system substrate-binding protein
MYLDTYIAGLLALVWISTIPPASAQPTPRDVLVFAAASLKDGLDGAAAEWRKETGKRAVVSYAASSALARQIEKGAPAEIFLSADLDWMDYLASRKLIRPETRTNLLGNRIVLIASSRSSVGEIALRPGLDLVAALGGDRLALADVNAVPAGKYARAALETLGVWASVAGRIAQAENARAALLLVSRGEAPLGIVYRTDATADPGVKVIGTFPEDSHPPILYPAALIAGTANPDATAFLAFLRSPAASAVFVAQGFTVVD